MLGVSLSLLFLLCGALSSCSQVEKEVNSVWVKVSQFLDFQDTSIQAKPSPSGLPGSPVNSASDDEGYSSGAAKSAQENAQILREILQVVFNREPSDRTEFGTWADTLNQGASLEGVYNGLTHSADYRKLEAASGSASADALVVFGEELAYLEVELPSPTQFDLNSASPPSGIETPEPENPTTVVEFKKEPSGLGPQTPPQPKPDLKVLSEKYSKLFVGASLFTLKRVIGDESIRVIGKKMQFREKLALWYSQWAVRIAKRKVDFGIPLRNKSDEAFHYKWAVESPEDRVKWEVLNRLHRLLNEANRQKQ